MSVRLTKIDDLILEEYRFLNADDECYFLGEYTARKGFRHSETNNQIISFKMKPVIKNQNQYRWKYKDQAITYWATKLSQAKPLSEAVQGVWVPIPGSCAEGDANYDDRILRLVRRAYGNAVRVANCFVQNGNRVAAHDSENQRPDVEAHKQNWITDFSEISDSIESVYIIDDVLARGASFRAASDLIKQARPKVKIVGIFLARNVHEDNHPSFDFDALFGDFDS